MKKIFSHKLFLALIVCILSFSAFAQTKNSIRERTSFNENWLFQKDDPAGAEGVLRYENIKDWVRVVGQRICFDIERRKIGATGGKFGRKCRLHAKRF